MNKLFLLVVFVGLVSAAANKKTASTKKSATESLEFKDNALSGRFNKQKIDLMTLNAAESEKVHLHGSGTCGECFRIGEFNELNGNIECGGGSGTSLQRLLTTFVRAGISCEDICVKVFNPLAGTTEDLYTRTFALSCACGTPQLYHVESERKMGNVVGVHVYCDLGDDDVVGGTGADFDTWKAVVKYTTSESAAFNFHHAGAEFHQDFRLRCINEFKPKDSKRHHDDSSA